MEIIKFVPEHLTMIDPQPWQKRPENALAMQDATGHAWTAMVNDKTMACAGVVELWPGRAFAWALIDKDAGRHMIGITRAVKNTLAWLPYRRIEMAVIAGFDEGMRWAEMLGFKLETPEPMPLYFPGGESAYQFSKVM